MTGVEGAALLTLQAGVIFSIWTAICPEQDLRRGDTILTYAYGGEGFSAVWFKGKYHTQFDISFAKLPDGTWDAEAPIARPPILTSAGSCGGPK